MRERRVNWETSAWLLWRLTRGRRDVQCIIGLVSHGLQTRFVFDGQLLSEYMVDNWAEASTLAGQRRAELESEGWIADFDSEPLTQVGQTVTNAPTATDSSHLHPGPEELERTKSIHARADGRRRFQ